MLPDIPHLEYNTERPHLNISEYGRNIQKMIDYAISVEDRELRNTIAKSIITVMGQLNPHLRDVTDFTHKLWDHLFVISDFKLDVDSPYPKPAREILNKKPEKISYPSKDIKFMHYGKNVELLIQKAIAMEEGPEKSAFTEAIANLMKRFYVTFNQDSVNDEVIFKHLERLSQGKLKQGNIRLAAVSDIATRPSSNVGILKKKKKSMKPGMQHKKKKY
ncbi:MAG: DUF4290 domain-containing protein [Bacteroidetes bacterium]|nr:DUF4290 domain-containing protein [Bacteroidota bacterium]HET6245786.1 DUF4290 domain-containing protein [Bacteroidia bacterium]